MAASLKKELLQPFQVVFRALGVMLPVLKKIKALLLYAKETHYTKCNGVLGVVD